MTSRPPVSYLLKFAISHVLYYTGLLQLWQRIALRRKAVVLMYHRVLTVEERMRSASHPALAVDRDTFAKQMSLLRRRFSVLSVDEFADRMHRKIPFPDSSCLITFDDGWRDSFTNAAPVLRQHRLPAVVFLSRNYVGAGRLFWQEALTHLLVRAIAIVRADPSQRARLAEVLAPACLLPLLDTPRSDPRPAVVAAVAAQKPCGASAVRALTDRLAGALGVPVESLGKADGFMDWDQVEAMRRDGIAFGGHGVDHLLLTTVAEADAEREIRGAKEMLDERFAGAVPTFSYPNGYVDDTVVSRVKAAGYRLAFITRRGFVRADDDPFTIRRLNVQESTTSTTPMFLARLVGLW